MNQRTGLYRSSKDTMIGGVAAGLAEYLKIDPTIIRLLFVLMVVVGGSGVLLYIILWIVLPSDENIIINEKDFTMEENNAQEQNQNQQFNPEDNKYKKKDDGSLIAGLILIALGVIFLVIRYFPRIDFGDLWPIILIIIGIVLLRNAFVSKKQ
jgi:phage shock protein PspC (stress-responsive transcriptional regulator)